MKITLTAIWPEPFVAQPSRYVFGYMAARRRHHPQARTPALRLSTAAHQAALRSQHGVSLIECLAYIALVTLVLGLASAVFFRCWDDSKHLRRNADDIVRALYAGEQWRADVRTANGPIQVTDLNDTENVVIPGRSGKIIYTCASGVLRRQTGAGAPMIVELEHVKSSRMSPEPRPPVTAWRWELELQPGQKQVRMLPLFTFETVAGQNSVP